MIQHREVQRFDWRRGTWRTVGFRMRHVIPENHALVRALACLGSRQNPVEPDIARILSANLSKYWD